MTNSKRRRVSYNIREVRPDLLTQQQFINECDMNRIVQNAQRGIPPRFASQSVGTYGDFSEVPDMTQAMNKIAIAQQAFMTLPARLRLELGNDFTRINELSAEQIRYYRLGKPQDALEPEEPLPPPPAEKPKASTRSKAAGGAPVPGENE